MDAKKKKGGGVSNAIHCMVFASLYWLVLVNTPWKIHVNKYSRLSISVPSAPLQMLKMQNAVLIENTTHSMVSGTLQWSILGTSLVKICILGFYFNILKPWICELVDTDPVDIAVLLHAGGTS